MTALMPERPVVDTAAISAGIAALLERHGIHGADVSVRTIEQGGMYAGVTISAMAYERPAHLPPPDNSYRDDPSPLWDLVERLEGGPVRRRPALSVLPGGAQ
ncbi:hypothetical protein [Actinomadura sp. WAC 06369]|uniref:hypothetical protein n=1 Tax=Actinomadura sp. WAC 06369 TaxID=2203193 RepID=UPI000F799E02|nr:hypothetical protein [Actinomadura sp. WAC 06369]RSN71359.1 hypothetical protein DMH08_02860 [Actinomadura sp. WAC 06369]